MADSQFVVHEHHTTRVHYDFRLELGGVLKSWAVPKGPSVDPRDKRLAVMVADHPIEYASFEGIIPPEYHGAGAIIIWDRGTYNVLEGNLVSGRLLIELVGKKLNGGFILTRLKRGGAKDWLLVKRRDEHVVGDWRTTPELTAAVKKSLQVKIPPCEGD